MRTIWRLIRVVLGLGCLAAAGWLGYTTYFATDTEPSGGGKVAAPGERVLRLEQGHYRLWFEGVRRLYNCDGTMAPDQSPHQEVRLNAVAGGRRVPFRYTGGCKTIFTGANVKRSLSTYDIPRTGRYRLSLDKRYDRRTALFVAPALTTSEQTTRTVIAALLAFLAFPLLFALRGGGGGGDVV